MKLNKLNKNVLFATLAYVALLYFVTGVFDLFSFALYVGIGFAISNIANTWVKGRLTNKRIFIIGAFIPAIYNILGFYAGWFAFDMYLVLLAAIEQGALLMITFMFTRKSK